MHRLADEARVVLTEAIRAGGTTLRDFYRSDGRPGYFRTKLMVYGKNGSACPNCGDAIRQIVIGQRSTFYCPGCQR
jgi:formamidopyrimidine-DNA glycosylase